MAGENNSSGSAAGSPSGIPLTPEALSEAFTDDFIVSAVSHDPAIMNEHVRLNRLILCLMGATILSILINMYQAAHPPAPMAIATNDMGQTSLIHYTGTPINTEPEVKRWVTDAIVQAYTFDFANFYEQELKSRLNFTPEGWDGFTAALDAAGISEGITKGQFKSSAVPEHPTVLSRLPMGNGRKEWVFQVPILVTYEGASGTLQSQHFMVTVTVVKQSVSEQPRGLGIASVTVG